MVTPCECVPAKLSLSIIIHTVLLKQYITWYVLPTLKSEGQNYRTISSFSYATSYFLICNGYKPKIRKLAELLAVNSQMGKARGKLDNENNNEIFEFFLFCCSPLLYRMLNCFLEKSETEGTSTATNQDSDDLSSHGQVAEGAIKRGRLTFEEPTYQNTS